MDLRSDEYIASKHYVNILRDTAALKKTTTKNG